jgi:hypothetical protein
MDRTEADFLLEAVDGNEVAEVFLSPDDAWIGYYERERVSSADERSWLKRIPFDGGAADTLLEFTGVEIATIDWAHDGSILYSQGVDLWQLMPGEAPVQLIEAQPGERLLHPQLLPGGDHVLFTAFDFVAAARAGSVTREELSEFSRIFVQSLSTEDRQLLVDVAWDGRYVAPGHLVYRKGNTLYGAAFDADTRAVGTVHLQLEQEVSNDSEVAYGVSASGTLVYSKDTDQYPDFAARLASRGDSLVWVHSADGDETPVGLTRSFNGVAVSPNGQTVAVTIRNDEAGSDIWRFDVDRPQPVRVTQTPTTQKGPPFWVDDERIVYHSVGSTGEEELNALRIVSAFRPTEPPRTLHDLGVGSTIIHWMSVIGDGSELLFGGFRLGGSLDASFSILSLDANADGAYDVRPFTGIPVDASRVAVSPNEDWVLYELYTDSNGIYIDRFPESERPAIISDANGGQAPAWSADGEEIFYRRATDGAMMRLPMSQTREFELPAEAFPDRDYLPGLSTATNLTPEGQFLMVKRGQEEPESDSPFAASDGKGEIVIVTHFDQVWKQRLDDD